MGSEAVKKDAIGIPQAESNKTNESLPVVPEAKPEEKTLTPPPVPVVPQPLGQTSDKPGIGDTEIKPLPETNTPAATEEIKAITVPKTEEVKPIETIKKIDETKASSSKSAKTKKEAAKPVKDKKKKAVTDKKETIKK